MCIQTEVNLKRCFSLSLINCNIYVSQNVVPIYFSLYHQYLKTIYTILLSEQLSPLNIRQSDDKTCFYASLYLDEWKGNERKEKEQLCDSLNILMNFVMKPGQTQFRSLAFDMMAVNKVKWPENKYLNEILASIERNKPSIPIHLYQQSEEQFEKTCKKIHEWCIGVAGKYTHSQNLSSFHELLYVL